jgi:hypothetical protein
VLVLLATAGLGTVVLAARTLPMELKVYTLVAVLLVMALAEPGSVAFGSIPRFAYGILTLPAALALGLRRRWMLVAAAAAGVGLQYLWVLNVWSGRLGVAP